MQPTLPEVLRHHGIAASQDRTGGWPKSDDLFTETEARQLAHKLNNDGPPEFMTNVAHAVPEDTWGGTEDGWTVSLRPVPGEAHKRASQAAARRRPFPGG